MQHCFFQKAFWSMRNLHSIRAMFFLPADVHALFILKKASWARFSYMKKDVLFST